MEIVKSLNGSSLLITGVSRTIKNETKELKDEFLGMFQVHQVQFYQEIYKQVKQ